MIWFGLMRLPMQDVNNRAENKKLSNNLILLINRAILLHNNNYTKGYFMETNKTEAQPEVGEFKGKPTLRIPLVEEPSANTPWHWFTFGKSKAKAIVKYYDAIKKFAEE